ncbi:MAG: hypothetical protein HYW02_02870 [Deltaproteobacteria bacterium]|nr:hypothetical protein [Deltaproteobacteria bacterium]
MRKTWFTLNLFVSLLLMPAAELWAINWSEFMRDDRMFVGAEITQINDWRLPEGCRRESLSPNDDEVEEEDCERIICDGHFWGKSAIDVCCAEEVTTEGEGEEAPQPRQKRRPHSLICYCHRLMPILVHVLRTTRSHGPTRSDY